MRQISYSSLIIAIHLTDEDLLTRRRLGKTNLSVKPSQIGTSNATKRENLGVFEYAHLRAPLPKDLKGSEIFPSHTLAQQPETYFLMRRSKDGFVSATGMFKIAFPWAKAEEERTEREYLKAREHTSEEEVAGNVWISPGFALELSKEYKMYEWVRALLDPSDIAQSPSSAKKQITPPPKFEIPEDEPPVGHRHRRGRSASPSKSSPRKSRTTRITKDVTSTPSTNAANASLQSTLDISVSTATLDAGTIPELEADTLSELKSAGSPSKKPRARKTTRATTAEPEEETKEEAKEEKTEKKKVEKKTEKKEKKKEEPQAEPEVEVAVATETAAEDTHTTEAVQPTISLDLPISLPEVPSAAETQEMIAKAKSMVEDAIKAQADGTPTKSAVTVTKKRKPEDDDEEETSAEARQRAKKARVLENKLKQERVRNRSIFGVSVAFALAASIPYFF
ncbi:unnamed protein product [Penicillium salamii]|uniref:Cell pattern formation-associated protein stuA n=1 Tax=Penicillium salamii TaxID=1612424 RepID=A0A9W4N6W3_9EURO|nr:unnamed protein product [Penicillium salamii]CAG8035062.1 unnamed protein product [Penicillium salamii]CAG8088128.1 unnamed protein product [Penicillium salamii]CAG8204434.1 unnamed protein product [Penicillium salamii]CAG8219113.1 unnamed protein product [Penicillium salamii]